MQTKSSVDEDSKKYTQQPVRQEFWRTALESEDVASDNDEWSRQAGRDLVFMKIV